MCGRFLVTSPPAAIAGLFEAMPEDLGPPGPRPNVSPTEPIAVVANRAGGRVVTLMRWGLLPHWYKTPNDGPLLFNARAETIATKAAFREATRERRCLIPADGFYEWQGEKAPKTPFVITARAGGIIAFAGVWQEWRGMPTCAIVTCPANATLAPIHERMPVVIAPADFALWLGEAGHGAARLMQPAPEDALQAVPADAATRAMLATRPARTG